MPGRSLGAQSAGSPSTPRTPEAALRSAQAVSVMLAFMLLLGGGLMAFWGMTRASTEPSSFPPPPPPPATTGTDIFPVMVPVVGAVCLAGVVVIPGVMVRAAQKRWEARADDEAAHHRVYSDFVSLSVLQAALLEGPGLMGSTVTYLTGNGFYLIAPAAAVVFLGVLFPRTARMERWIDEVTGHPPTGQAAPPLHADDEAA